MAGWNTNPSWNSLASINEGFKFTSISDISPSDFNKLVENMQFLYTNYLNSEGGELDMKRIYPVGSIYLSLEETFHPAEAFGGTWERIQDRFLLGAGDYSDEYGTEGGETSHTLTTNEMPAHSGHIHELATSNYYLDTKVLSSNGTFGNGWKNESGEAYPFHKTLGGSAAHNNMPPYLAVYMWKREA